MNVLTYPPVAAFTLWFQLWVAILAAAFLASILIKFALRIVRPLTAYVRANHPTFAELVPAELRPTLRWLVPVSIAICLVFVLLYPAHGDMWVGH